MMNYPMNASILNPIAYLFSIDPLLSSCTLSLRSGVSLRKMPQPKAQPNAHAPGAMLEHGFPLVVLTQSPETSTYVLIIGLVFCLKTKILHNFSPNLYIERSISAL
jgi:hypothetical protein